MTSSEDTVDSSKASQVLCNSPPGEDVVITGMAGKFPDSDDVQELRDNLFNKVDLVSDDDRRWKPTNSDIPQRTGKLNDISSFDAGFFGIYSRRANNMDIYVRMMLETTYETILDAGFHPSELAGTKTGVFIAAGFSDSENYYLHRNFVSDSVSVIGTTRSMVAHCVSYFLRLEGPSFVTDSGCSSAMYAIEYAYRSIREGICDMAIVGGTNLCLHPNASLHFARLGVLSPEGRCKTFDKNADGYVRSETCSALFLQKSKNARRIYAHVVNCKLNCDGYKQEGTTHPSSMMQTALMKEIYKECNVDFSDVSFIEAHGTGTKVGDLQELNALADVFCAKRRKQPLYIGTVKSNVGHTEPAAAILGVIKVLLGMESELIIPNINYSQPREDVDALVKGHLRVISEKTSWPNEKGIAGVNSLGIGGANGHLILSWNRKVKGNCDLPQDDLPRLLCASGRTKEAIDVIWKDLSSRCLDFEFMHLLNSIFEKPTVNHPFRGFQIFSKTEKLMQSVSQVVGEKNKLVWVFNNFDSNWPKFGKQLVTFPAFAEALETIQSVMTRKFDVDIIKVVETSIGETRRNQILGTMAVQICLAALLKKVGLIPDTLIGLGTGELIAAYFEGYLTLDEVIYGHLSTAVAFCNNTNKSLIKEEILNNLKNLKLSQSGRFQKWLPLHRFLKQGSPEYFARNLVESFGLVEAEELLSNDCEILVIGGQIKNFERSSLILNDSRDCVFEFMTKLGRFYEKGHDMHINNLYAKITWPVSRSTPMISPLIKWEHTQKWHVPFHETADKKRRQHTVLIDMKSKDWSFITGHVVDGRILFPATGYLFLVWKTLAEMQGKPVSRMKIVFEHVKFLQAVNLNKREEVRLVINILKSTNTFEISERDTLLVTGIAYEVFDSKRITVDLLESKYEEEKVTLEHAEIYRELRLRGYEFKGEFKAIKCEVGQQNVLINWTGNWVTFLDSMLQTMALYAENRELYVPTSIKHIVIDPLTHLEAVYKRKGPHVLIPVRSYYDLDIIRSPGVEFRRIKRDIISRRKNDEPLLEAYKFIPNVTALSLNECIRVIVQIIVENERVRIFKSVELAGELELLSTYMKHALDDLPLMEAEIVVLTNKKSPKLHGIKFQDGSLPTQDNSLIVILSDALQKCEMLYDALKLVKLTGGYILSRESLHFDISDQTPTGLDILCVYSTEKENLVLLHKSTDYKQPTVIKVSDDLSWLPAAKSALKGSQRLIFYSQNTFTNGILGLVNCLRKEPNSDCLSCFFIMDKAPEFDVNHPFYARQIKKNMTVNVWKAGQWGTYRHLPLKRNVNAKYLTYYANVTIPGDLSSIQFIEGNLKTANAPEVGLEMVYIYCGSLNFRDLLIASGRIPVDTAGTNRSDQESLLGFEFSGRDTNGKRVMGIVGRGALASHVVAKQSEIWTIPDHWSLEDAATVPGAYLTAIYALIIEAKIKHGQSILIHQGAGGVGQAAVIIALHFDCTIFVTVGTQEKKCFLKSKYPQIQDAHIGNSRDTSFEQVVLLQTRGRGVDIVLNSLTEDKLQASLRCLAQNGIFLEIGKFDLIKDNNLEMRLLEKGISFQSVMIDLLYEKRNETKLKQASNQFGDLLKKGVVKPLTRTVFEKGKITDAFKLMATGKNIGKILVNIRKEEEETIVSSFKEEFNKGLPRYHCEADGIYLIVGGLGGFGLQLAEWLILRGARKIILSSRMGLKTGYQAKMLKMWKPNVLHISVRTDDVATEEGCLELISFAKSLGPVKAIFNLALVLKDDLFENQTVESFKASLAPKALATQYFDTITRTMCPELSEFVVFSSACCARGNMEQSNYGMANSIMERICEKRKAEGFCALAIQWGAIGDVGAIAEMQENVDSEVVICGYRQQRISSCLQVLDVFLRQEEPIVSSIILAHKNKISVGSTADVILNTILGIKDKEKINHHATFAELGMDSIMSAEIKQILERELEMFLTSQNIRALTVAKLQELLRSKSTNQELRGKFEAEEEFSNYLQNLFKLVGRESFSREPVIRMGETIQDDATKIVVLPGLEGTINAIKPLLQNLNKNIICVQYSAETTLDTVEEWAKFILPYLDIQENNFVLLAHSFGCVVATELAYLLEKTGRLGKLVFIDGAPTIARTIYRKIFGSESEEDMETNVVCMFLAMHLSISTALKNKKEMLKCVTLEERIRLCLKMFPNLHGSDEYLFELCLQCCRLLKAHLNYDPKFPKLKSSVKLIKPKLVPLLAFSEDYGLSSLFENVEKVEFDGQHLSILGNPEVARAINEFIRNNESMNQLNVV